MLGFLRHAAANYNRMVDILVGPTQYTGMKTIKDAKVGDRVLMVDVNARGAAPREVTVIKVGRVNLFIRVDAWNRDDNRPFDRETGRVKDAYEHQTLWTPEEYALHAEAKLARTRLRDKGVNLESYLSDETVLAISAALIHVLGVT